MDIRSIIVRAYIHVIMLEDSQLVSKYQLTFVCVLVCVDSYVIALHNYIGKYIACLHMLISWVLVN